MRCLSDLHRQIFNFLIFRFRHPDYDPDRAQKLISSSMSRHLSTCKISSKSTHAFLSNLANRQPDRQTDKHRGQSHITPLSELKLRNNKSTTAGGTKMLSFSNLSDRCTQLRQITWCLAMQALVHCHHKLVCDSICHIEPMQLRVEQVCQAVHGRTSSCRSQLALQRS